MSAQSKIGASASWFTASTVPAERVPITWLNLPCTPSARYMAGATLCPVIPTCRALGNQDLSVTLRVPASSAPSTSRSGRRLSYSSGGTDAPTQTSTRATSNAQPPPASGLCGESLTSNVPDWFAGRAQLEHAGSHGRHLDPRGGGDRSHETAAERGLPRDQATVFDPETHRVTGEPGSEGR